MATRVAAGLLRSSNLLKISDKKLIFLRTKTTARSGRVLPQPKTSLGGLVALPMVVTSGLFTGAYISKEFANFLEENDLFVPEDDDDDD